MAQPSVHGRFIWQELMTTDTAAATSFYSKIVGWRVQPPDHPSTDYSVFAADSGSVGGAMPLSEEARSMGARPHWLPYIGAENVDDTVADTKRLGGKVLRPATDIENLGRYAVLADPQGAAFGIYRPLRPAASSTKSQPERGEFSWQELATSDYEAAYRFYNALFGWEALQRMDMGPAGTYLVFGRDGVQHGGIYKLSAQMPAPYWLPYIEVADVEALIGPAREGGGRVITGPMDVPGGGRIAQLLDSGGVLFAVHAGARAAADVQHAPRARSARRHRASVAAASASSAGAPAEASATGAAKKAPTKRAAGNAKSAPAATKRPAGKVARKAAKRATKQVAKQVAKPVAKKAVKTAAKKGARKSAGKIGKTGKKVAGKPARRVAGRRLARARLPVRAPRRAARRGARRRR